MTVLPTGHHRSLAGAVFLIVFALFWLTFLGWAQAAQLPVPVRACASDVAVGVPPDEIWQLWDGWGIEAADRCPEGIALDNPGTSHRHDMRGWEWRPVRGVNVDRVEFTISGGDNTTGVDYGYAQADSLPTVDLPERTSESDPERFVVDQPGGVGFFVSASCNQAECQPSRELVLSDFEFTVSDDVGPSFFGSINGLDLNYQPIPTVSWTNGFAVPFDVLVMDDGFGLNDASVTISDPLENVELWRDQPACRVFDLERLNTTALCDMTTRYLWRADLRGLAQGVHGVTLRASDAIGNESSLDGISLGVDSVAPDAPDNPTWIGTLNANGWTGDPGGRLRWDPPAPPVQPDQQSPLQYVKYSVRKIGGPSVEPTLIHSPTTETREIVLPSEGPWRLSAWYTDEAGNEGDKANLDIGYDSDSPAPPVLATNKWVSREQLISGYSQAWTPPEAVPELESGICGYAVLTDDRTDTVPPVHVDVPKAAFSAQVPAGLSEGTHYVHVRAISCADRGSATATAELKVDATPPQVDLVGDTGTTWSRDALPLTIVPTDELSGVAELRYSVDGEPSQHATTSVPVLLGEGVHTLTYTARDLAGNESPTVTRVLAVDGSAPTVEFETGDPDAPRTIAVIVRDQLSGLATAQIEYRRVDAQGSSEERLWKHLGSAEIVDPDSSNVLRFERTIPDEKLPAGRYEFRATASDAAGNTTQNADGNSGALRALTLPIRKTVEVYAAVADVQQRCVSKSGKACRSAAACPKKLRCRNTNVVLREHAATRVIRAFGRRTTLVGEVFDDRGRPLAGTALAVYAKPKDRDEFRVADAVTDAGGRFESAIADGPTRSFVVRYAGDEHNLPGSAEATLGIRAGVTLKLSRKRLHSGATLLLSGRLRSGSDWLSRDGKLVVLQYLSAAGWSPAVATPHTDHKGNFIASYRWPKVTRPTTFVFRAHVPAEALWPFAPGSSAGAKVRVLP